MTSMGKFLEQSWKSKEKHADGEETHKDRGIPANLQTRVVSGVNDKLISLTSPIDNLKMGTSI